MYNEYQYDPYTYYYPNAFYPIYPQKPTLLQSMRNLSQQMNISSTIRTAQKTLYTVNQIIPIINQLRPIIHNASTAFKVAKAVKSFNDEGLDEEIDHDLTNETQQFENMI